jgi:hypothetical protein
MPPLSSSKKCGGLRARRTGQRAEPPGRGILARAARVLAADERNCRLENDYDL